MKRCLNVTTALSFLLMLSSCTTTRYTHQQVLQNCHKKEDVLKQFGPPDEINPGVGAEQWTYDMNKLRPRKKSKSPVDVKSLPDSLVKDSLQYVNRDKYTAYVKFMFDDKGNVVGYNASGVDLSRKEKDSFGKSLLNITGGVLVVSALVALELFKDGAFDN